MLFTRCPDCETTFRITADALGKAGGQVRCGRCACVFDAYAELREQRLRHAQAAGEGGPRHEARADRDVDAATVVAQPDHAGASAETAAGTEEAAAAVAGVGGNPGAPARSEGDDDADRLAAAASFVGNEARLDAGSVLETEAADASPAASLSLRASPAESDTLDDFSVTAILEDIESSRLDDELDAPAAAGLDEPLQGRAASSARGRAPAAAAEAQSAAEPDALVEEEGARPWRLLDERPPPARRESRVWPYAAAGAALVLALQVANHFRSQLAGVDGVGPILREAYAALGVDVIPQWNVKQYEIVDWVATAEPNANGRGSLKITARIQNKGPRSQPFPDVHLQLKDRWEKAVASRMFHPAEYLTAGARPDVLMGPGATAHAELEVVDPGPDAYGFELDVCIEQPNHSLRCAADKVFR